nr:IS30 family transposase [uncultured Treponema sp.]
MLAVNSCFLNTKKPPRNEVALRIWMGGGTEFMDIEGIERSCIDGKQRTKLYFAHPYTACERGTNENHNRILRRFFPKGCDFSKVTDEEVSKAKHWMNNYPRRIHGGKTPAMIYKKCCNF